MSMSAAVISDLELPSRGPEGLIEQTHGSRKHITLKYNTDHWEVKDHTDAVPAFVDVGAAYYVPPITIRGINACSITAAVQIVYYDTEYNGVEFVDIAEMVACNMIHPLWPSKIHLDSTPGTNDAVEMHLHG